jgi:hypothetical protein
MRPLPAKAEPPPGGGVTDDLVVGAALAVLAADRGGRTEVAQEAGVAVARPRAPFSLERPTNVIPSHPQHRRGAVFGDEVGEPILRHS